MVVKAMSVSAIICTYDRAESIAMTLQSLAVQSLPDSSNWEVLVVDNNSRDRTRQVVEEFCHRFPERFRYIFEGQQGKTYALNRGIREARGAVIAFTDDDVIVETSWLQNLTADLESGPWSGAGGRTLPEKGFVPPRWLDVEKKYALAPLAIFDMGCERCQLLESPFGNNMAFRKTVLESYGGFRTDLGPRAGSSCPQKSEDSELGTRLLLAGERILYKPDAVLYHSIPEERVQKKYFLRWWYDKARSDIQAFGIPDPERCVLGVPSRFLRRLATWTIRWIVAVGPSRRFTCKVNVWTLIGQIHECYSQHIGLSEMKGCD